MDRRSFLKSTGTATVGGLILGPGSLQGLVARAGLAYQGKVAGRAGLRDGGYGPLEPAGPELALPRGFTYRVIGVEGSIMSDGRPTPRAHDGMAAFAAPNGNVRLLRNHEDRGGPRPPICDVEAAYDSRAAGGVTAIEVEPDGDRAVVFECVALGGTIFNCAGGPTPWGTWLTCEEAVGGVEHGWDRPHGYVFEVPMEAEGPVEPVMLPGMGRFVHEAVAIDPATGIVYLTEDAPRSGFYRFIPAVPDDLRAGGRLQMLAVRGRPNYETGKGQHRDFPLPVAWVDIQDPDPAHAGREPSAVFDQGWARGGARFRQLEGCWYGNGSIYFNATNGGDVRLGQVWEYHPREDGGRLILLFESTGPDVLNRPDNICVSPRGGIVLCEDGSGDIHLRGLTPDGRIFDFARNLVNRREFAGATFSPDGRTLFVNLQGDTTPGGPRPPGNDVRDLGPLGAGGAVRFRTEARRPRFDPPCDRGIEPEGATIEAMIEALRDPWALRGGR